ncbi:hypothetical protein ACWKSP_26330 [Micromonosporaceae bacterium Da 78-11]
MTTTGIDLTPATVSHRRRMTRTLTLEGESAADIATRLGVAQRTVTRYRAALRRPAKKDRRTDRGTS